MPTFDYQCNRCGGKREVWIAPVRDGEATAMELPCNNPRDGMCEHTRVPSAPAVIIPAKHRAA
jgi:hypothetical protein